MLKWATASQWRSRPASPCRGNGRCRDAAFVGGDVCDLRMAIVIGDFIHFCRMHDMTCWCLFCLELKGAQVVSIISSFAVLLVPLVDCSLNYAL